MVNLSALSQNQLWGLAYACQRANEGKEQGDRITVQQYADSVFASACDSYYANLINDRIQGQVIPALLSLPQQDQEQMISEFNLPNMITDPAILQEVMGQ